MLFTLAASVVQIQPPRQYPILYFSGWLSMAFGNRRWLRVHHTKPSNLGWSVVVGLYKLMTPPIPKSLGQPT